MSSRPPQGTAYGTQGENAGPKRTGRIRTALYGEGVDAELRRLIDVAAEDLHTAAGGAALCRLTASGSPGATVKRAEGAWAALNALARSLADGGCDPSETAQQLRDTWNADLMRWSADPRSSWVPYCEGGISSLDEYITTLTG